MKKSWILLVLPAILLYACNGTINTKGKNSKNGIYFEEVEHDYGAVPVDGDGSYNFVFTNKSDSAIVINRVRSTCGCTVPRWPREPIEPGESGEIEVVYNTSVAGTFLKSIYVYSTASNSPVKLQIRGKVVANE